MSQSDVQPLASPAPAEPSPLACPRWAIHRRLYDWTLSFAHTRYALPALAVFSFIEAIFFPIPPFVLQIPLSLERRRRTWTYASVCTIFSVLGGMVGYALGLAFSGLAKAIFSESAMSKIADYSGNVWLLSVGVFAIHPYKLYTIAAGFLKIPFWSFVIASILGRGGMFFVIGLLLWIFGAPVRRLIDKYFNLLTILFGIAVIALFVLAKTL